ncbi:hypothetical protein MHYP_G00282240 [Metynnis hypsauchen]
MNRFIRTEEPTLGSQLIKPEEYLKESSDAPSAGTGRENPWRKQIQQILILGTESIVAIWSAVVRAC